MDRFASKSIETQTIYEIYRACRLCGAGGGYKMPIIQNVVNIDGCDVELKQKIRECVQIEVNQDDRMPPLICELCVDKVNDFYEFLEMCRQTNKRTRLRLGLPPQTMPRGAPDAGDCILGVTEPIYVNDEDSNEPLSKKSNVTSTRSTRFKKEPQKERKELKVKIGSIQMGRQCRSVRVRAPTPPRSARDKRDNRDSVSLSKLQTRQKRLPSPPPKSILKKGKDKKVEKSPSSVLSPRLKRLREMDNKSELPAKRVKIAAKPLPPRSTKTAPQSAPKKPESKEAAQSTQCKICKQKFKAPQAMVSHQRTHTVTFTNPKHACNACELWFVTADEASTHHKRHRSRPQSYRCRRCDTSYKLLQAYEHHTCLPWEEVPEVECPKCWRSFVTQNLLDYHKCPGISGRRGGKCSKCNKTFSNRKVLTKHENSCKKGNLVVDPEILSRLKPIQIRVAKCDPLLANVKQEHYDVSSVDDDFGLDKTCVYPYSASGLRIKSELSDCMVKINDMDFASYVHWDSDESGESDSENLDFSFTKQHKVESLAAWALKTIFSKKFLGKVPRKFRRLKIENIIGHALNDSLSDVNINDNKDKTVDSELSAKDSVAISDKDNNVSVDDRDDDDLFPKESKDKVTNDDFDSLFNSSAASDNNLSVTDKIDGKVNDSVSDSDDSISGKNSVLKESNNHSDSNIVDGNGDSKNATNEESMVETNSTESKEQSQKTNLDVETIGSESSLSKDEYNVKDDEKIDDSNGIEEVGLKSTEEKTPDAESGVKEAHAEMEVDSHTNSTETQEVVQKSNDAESSKGNVVKSNGEKLGEQEEINEECQESAKLASEDTKNHTNDSESLPKHESSKEACAEISTVSAKADTENTSTNNEDSKDIEISSNENKAKELTENDENLVNGTNLADDSLNMDDLEDWSDSEMDDCKLMADLDEQIGEKATQDSKASESETRNKIPTEGSKMEVDEDKIVRENLLPKEDVANKSDKELKVAE